MKTWGLDCEKAAPGTEVVDTPMEKTWRQEACAGSDQGMGWWYEASIQVFVLNGRGSTSPQMAVES